MEEVTSNPRPTTTHPAGLSALSQRVHEADAAAELMKRTLRSIETTAKVMIYLSETCTLSQSPRFRLGRHYPI